MPKRKRYVDEAEPLRRAVQNGNYERAEALLLENGDMVDDQVFSCGWNALHCAIDTGDYGMVQLLLRHDVDVDVTNNFGFTALQRACSRGLMEIVKLLMQHTNLNAKSDEGKIPLHSWIFHWASDKNHLEIIKKLLEMGFKDDIDSEDKNQSTPLHTAVELGHLEIAQYLVLQGANLEIHDCEGHTPLQCACLHHDRHGRNIDIIKLLIEHGANVHSAGSNNGQGWTLRWACDSGQLEIIKLLADKKLGYINAKYGNYEETPLHWAVYKRPSYKFVLTESQGLAEEKRRLEVIRYLFKSGVNINAKDNDRQTPLHRACVHCRWEAAKLLIANDGIELNATEKEGKTALYFACLHGNLDVVKLLLSRGATADTKTSQGITPLKVACELNHLEVVWLLVRHHPFLVSE